MINALSISAMTFDLNGSVYIGVRDFLPAKSRLSDSSRRSTRDATLDGKASLYDTGLSASDRTITLVIPPDKINIIEKLEYLKKTYSELILILYDGAYVCHIKSQSGSSNVVFKIWIIKEA